MTHRTLISPPPAVQAPARRVWCAWRIVLAIIAMAMLTTWAHAEVPAKLLADLQAAKPGSEAQKRAGQRICQAERGPLAIALWTADGHLVCRLITVEARR